MRVTVIAFAFTCTGPYAVLIMLGIKRVENRSVMPEPAKGRCAVSCSKSFCREEYGNFVQWASRALPPEDFDRIPSWSDVADWPGRIVGTCDYEADGNGDSKWNEGCPCWWHLSKIVCFDAPIPCRGNVGMWQMPSALAAPVLVSLGTETTTVIQPSEVFAEAIKVGANSIIVAHNHPSGNLTPSKADIAATKELKDLATRLKVNLLDHLIVNTSTPAYLSLAEEGVV